MPSKLLSNLLTSCLTTVKNHIILYCEKIYERSGKNLFGHSKIHVRYQISSNREFFVCPVYLHMILLHYILPCPHNLIKDKLVDLIEIVFHREGSLYVAYNDRNAFFTSGAVRNYNSYSCQKVYESLIFLLDNIYIRFGSELYRQIVGILVGTNCASIVTDLFLYC